MPEKPGVYLFLNLKNKILYVGKAVNLKKRVASYFTNRSLGEKTRQLISETAKINHLLVGSEIEALLLEANLIKKHQPKYNVDLKDDKAYPFIKITVSGNWPKVSITRKIENSRDLFFGPYPDSKTLYFILRTIRRIFPYRSCQTLPKKPCLYFHLHRCPGCCFLPQNLSFKKTYQKEIKKIILFLQGKSRQVLNILEKEMAIYAYKELYEEAAKRKVQIEQIKKLLAPTYQPLDYLSNPNLITDLRTQELRKLYQLLLPYYPHLSSNLCLLSFRIECFDISNLSGKLAVGSMVVFIGGEADKRQYRRFKIRTKQTPDDVAMIKEITLRRLNHHEWPYPQLMVVDGGLPQVNAAVLILKLKGFKIPVIGLAKRLEQIFLANGQNISLPKDSPALLLLQRIRDEAHRFALSYHRKLRKKVLLLNYEKTAP